MKRILVAADEFYPYENANTVCLDKILDALVRSGFDVTVLCFSYEPSLPPEAERRGCHVRRIRISFDRFEKFLHLKIFHMANPVSKLLFVLFSRIEYIFGRVRKTRRLLRLCRSMRDKPFDLLVSGLCPIASHKLAYSITRREHIPWVLYNMDSFAFNCGPAKLVERRKKTEEKWCRKACAVVNTYGLAAHNKQEGYDPYRGLPQLEIPLPNLEIGETIPDQPARDGRITLRYTGNFFEDVRRPDALIAFLRKLDPQEVAVEFYGGCCAYVQQHFSDLPACLTLKGFASAERCRELTQTADILINVGNDCTNQMPSKVFEYIATGKPILNFYTREDEPGLQFLRRYPRILHLHDAADAGPDDLRALLQTPEITAQDLRNIYHDVLSETVGGRVAIFLEEVMRK